MHFYQFLKSDTVAPINESKPMAEPTNKVPENVPGPYYVDDTCIDCDMCRSTAPDFFARFDAGGYTYVHRQPQTPEEFARAEEGRLSCPTDSIGNDGATISAASAP